MRLISRKIWRAFPELDRYDDQVCRLYVRHAKRLKNAWKGVLLILATLFVALVVWVVLLRLNVGYIEKITAANHGDYAPIVITAATTGLFWFPVLCALIVRDLWLRFCIRSHLRTSNCARCGYNLIGLTILGENDSRFVVCPECGIRTALNTGHITESDINPELLHQT